MQDDYDPSKPSYSDDEREPQEASGCYKSYDDDTRDSRYRKEEYAGHDDGKYFDY